MEVIALYPVPRLDDWPAILRRFIDGRKRTPFAWGMNDCATFAADAVRAMTGVDPAHALRGYKSTVGAANRIRKHPEGVEGLAADAARRYGWPEVKPAFASRGDIVSLHTEHGRMLAVVDVSARTAWAPGLDGLKSYPLAEAKRAWKVG